MFTLDSRPARSIADLAARLTDPALEFLGRFRAHGDSVEMELDLWHALTTELKREMSESRTLLRPSDGQRDGALKRVVHRAILRVAAARSSFEQEHSRPVKHTACQLCEV